MKITVVPPSELGGMELAAWRGFQQSAGFDNPFMAPEFTLAVGRVRPATRVGVLEDGNAVVGFFPFERRSLGYGVPVAPGLNECQGVIHARGLDWDPNQLLRSCGLSFWEFDCLVEGQQPFAPYLVHRVPSPMMDLSRGFDAYLAERRGASSRIRDLPRRRRRLEREVGPARFAFDGQDRQALRRLMGWKSAQYRRTGRADRFAEPWIIELLDAMLETRAPGCTGRMSVLYAGDQIIAAHFGLSSSSTIPTWFPAYDTRFRPYSPGLLLHLDMARAASDAGVTCIDMGRGAKDYKEWLKSYDLVVAEGRVRRTSPGAALHWVRRAPVRRIRQVVLEHPALFHAADRALVNYGRLRCGSARVRADRSSAEERS
ncbi:MAG: polysaccharide biosynthesis protein CelD [Frankiales bacterium]|nr:polysaccharide biosynthesis protein CelD [Frankiales bacterium]